jgi:hypothetical protein
MEAQASTMNNDNIDTTHNPAALATLAEAATSAQIEEVSRDPVRKKMTFDEAAGVLIKHISSKKLNDRALAEVKLALRDQPEVWRTAGDLALQAKMRILESFNQPTAAEAISHGMEVIRKELGGSTAGPLEALLIDQVMLCWLNVHTIQMNYSNIMSQSVTLTMGAYWEKRLSTAQGRYLKAIATLAKVRRLSKATPLQVNIGGQQINVVGEQG